MKCPKCGKNTAYLHAEDGITEAGKNIEIEIMCNGDCMDKTHTYNEPERIATVMIDVIIKRGSINLYE